MRAVLCGILSGVWHPSELLGALRSGPHVDSRNAVVYVEPVYADVNRTFGRGAGRAVFDHLLVL